jgi:CheY-like chemotaxis protein
MHTERSTKATSQLVLFAEDDPEDRLLVRDAWERSKPENGLMFVSDGEELLDFLTGRERTSAAGSLHDADRDRFPDLVMLDLNMPRKDGREALREMRADRMLRHVPVVVFSTSDADRDIAAAYRLGANSYLAKPDSFSGLVRVFQTLKAYWLEAARLPPRAIVHSASIARSTDPPA